MSERTPETLNPAEIDEVFAILRSQDSILGIRLVERLYATLRAAERRAEVLEQRLAHELARLREAVCECLPRPDSMDVQPDNDPQHHDFSCPYRTGAPGGLLDRAIRPAHHRPAGPGLQGRRGRHPAGPPRGGVT